MLSTADATVNKLEPERAEERGWGIKLPEEVGYSIPVNSSKA